MKLYFSPMACSMASRIALYEAGADVTFEEVDSKTKLTSEGKDFRTVNPLGLVPVLDDGQILTENAAILQYIAARHPDAGLAPTDLEGRTRLQQWLCFVGTELHKGFATLLDRKAPEVVKAYALEKIPPRLALLEAHLGSRQFLLDRFSVADAYLVTVLGWTVVLPVDLEKWPAISEYMARLGDRPSVARAVAEERTLYVAERSREKAS